MRSRQASNTTKVLLVEVKKPVVTASTGTGHNVPMRSKTENNDSTELIEFMDDDDLIKAIKDSWKNATTRATESGGWNSGRFGLSYFTRTSTQSSSIISRDTDYSTATSGTGLTGTGSGTGGGIALSHTSSQTTSHTTSQTGTVLSQASSPMTAMTSDQMLLTNAIRIAARSNDRAAAIRNNDRAATQSTESFQTAATFQTAVTSFQATSPPTTTGGDSDTTLPV